MGSLSKTLRALFLGITLISLMVACAGAILLNELRRPADITDAPVEVVVDQGDTTSVIATKLRAAGLIRQPLLFTLLVRSQGLDESLKPGRFLLRSNMTMSQIISALQVSAVFDETQVLIKEGQRLEQVAELVGSSGLAQVTPQSFLASARHGDAFKRQHALLADLPAGASLEGYLFPDTYRFATTATVTQVIDIMLNRFDDQYHTFGKDVQVKGANVHQIVTMASIVQREAVLSDEMPKIAAVFWNRLKPQYRAETGNGKLQSDPTVQYGLGKPGDWWPNLDTHSSEQMSSVAGPYNTYANPGLPPGPISNPGLDALRAAAQPDESQPYLYFVASCPRDGTHKFTTSLDEFNRYAEESANCAKR